jgi:hypothetical protein
MTLIEIAQMRKQARELRASARRAEQEASLLERALDGALALRMLQEAPK